MEDRWLTYAVPLLRAVDQIETDPNRHPSHAVPRSEIMVAAGFAPDDKVALAELRRLIGGGYVEHGAISKGLDGTADYFELRLSPTGARMIGSWPTEVAGQVLAAIEVAAEDPARSEEERGRLRSVVAAVGTAGRDLVVQVAAEVLARQVPGR